MFFFGDVLILAERSILYSITCNFKLVLQSQLYLVVQMQPIVLVQKLTESQIEEIRRRESCKKVTTEADDIVRFAALLGLEPATIIGNNNSLRSDVKKPDVRQTFSELSSLHCNSTKSLGKRGKRAKNTLCHVYSFGRQGRKERVKTLETGLNKKSRMLKLAGEEVLFKVQPETCWNCDKALDIGHICGEDVGLFDYRFGAFKTTSGSQSEIIKVPDDIPKNVLDQIQKETSVNGDVDKEYQNVLSEARSSLLESRVKVKNLEEFGQTEIVELAQPSYSNDFDSGDCHTCDISYLFEHFSQ